MPDIVAFSPILPRVPRAVIFDMDGTLFDTEALYHRALLLAAQALGIAMDEDYPHRSIGLSWPVARPLFERDFGKVTEALRDRWVAIVTDLMVHSLALKPGVLEMLDLLDRLALPYGIATASYHPDVARNLAQTGLSGRFRVIVAQGDYAASKPAPDPFLLAAQQLGIVPGDCLALEDSVHGVRSALAAGMMTVMIPDIIAPDEALVAACSYVARDMHEVCGLVEGAFVARS